MVNQRVIGENSGPEEVATVRLCGAGAGADLATLVLYPSRAGQQQLMTRLYPIARPEGSPADLRLPAEGRFLIARAPEQAQIGLDGHLGAISAVRRRQRRCGASAQSRPGVCRRGVQGFSRR